jgi:hypothetical protein
MLFFEKQRNQGIFLLKVGILRGSGEWYDVADVLHAGDEEDESLESESESGMRA